MRLVTHSELKTFRRCKRKWWLANHREMRLKKEQKYGPMSSGNRVHRWLEVHYEHGPEVAVMDFEASIEADVLEYPEQAEAINKDADLVRAMVEGYLEWSAEEGLDEDLELVEPEAVLEVPLPGLDVLLIAKLDQRFVRRSTGERMFRDYKTVNDFSRVSMLPQDTQMKHYNLLERLADPDVRTGGAMYTMIRRVKRTARAKPPFFMNIEVRHNDQALRTYFHQVYTEVEEILQLEAWLTQGASAPGCAYPNPTNDCTWDCDFRPVCPMFDDGSDAEGMLSLLYESKDSLERYGSDVTGRSA